MRYCRFGHDENAFLACQRQFRVHFHYCLYAALRELALILAACKICLGFRDFILILKLIFYIDDIRLIYSVVFDIVAYLVNCLPGHNVLFVLRVVDRQ